ncbi:MAG: lipid A biosynthesis protein [Rhodanobacter sp.]|nr:MAG: lipid A biosynthesis protein [Rhodanobacter sp.]
MSLDSNFFWLLVGFTGQALFGIRFFVQWLYSESQEKSMVPPIFWYFSVAGGVVLLSYAIHRREPVFIVGESLTLLIFLRNLHLIRRNSSSDEG